MLSSGGYNCCTFIRVKAQQSIRKKFENCVEETANFYGLLDLYGITIIFSMVLEGLALQWTSHNQHTKSMMSLFFVIVYGGY